MFSRFRQLSQKGKSDCQNSGSQRVFGLQDSGPKKARLLSSKAKKAGLFRAPGFRHCPEEKMHGLQGSNEKHSRLQGFRDPPFGTLTIDSESKKVKHSTKYAPAAHEHTFE